MEYWGIFQECMRNIRAVYLSDLIIKLLVIIHILYNNEPTYCAISKCQTFISIPEICSSFSGSNLIAIFPLNSSRMQLTTIRTKCRFPPVESTPLRGTYLLLYRVPKYSRKLLFREAFFYLDPSRYSLSTCTHFEAIPLLVYLHECKRRVYKKVEGHQIVGGMQ